MKNIFDEMENERQKVKHGERKARNITDNDNKSFGLAPKATSSKGSCFPTFHFERFFFTPPPKKYVASEHKKGRTF